MSHPRLLATDLDGTLIPLDGHVENVRDLLCIERARRDRPFDFLFVTGRHLALTLEAVRSHGLPEPDVLVADVGTSIYEWHSGQWTSSSAYAEELSRIASEDSFAALRDQLSSVSGLRLQEQEKQGRFKLSYYVDAAKLHELAEEVRRQLPDGNNQFTIVDSVDPFTGDGLIDVLPAGVTKAFAVDWWRLHHDLSKEDFVFAGDSGNDLAALTAGYRAIVVGNASQPLKNKVAEFHNQSGWTDRLHIASNCATSGVLEGCRHFGLIQEQPELGTVSRASGKTGFSVWAPNSRSVSLELELDQQWTSISMPETVGDCFSTEVDACPEGTKYRFRLDNGQARPDPRSRFQPDGVHGPSAVIDPQQFAWTDSDWHGVSTSELIIYELHIGTFTPSGTYREAIDRLNDLVDLGVTAVELLPLASFPGQWNWGYDGVNLFAPSANYGTPDDLRAFVDAAHARGLAVILDVVYNHLGPEGNYLAEFGPYFSSRHQTPWGDGLNFDGDGNAGVRDHIIDNAVYWLDEFHFDGLRLDAVHAIIDDSRRHILADIRRAVSAYAAITKRSIHLIAETNLYDPTFLNPPDPSVAPYDAIWCDDLMHSIYSLTTPDVRHTQRPYNGGDDIHECLTRGYLYHGLPETRATNHNSAVDARSLVLALQNHDVVGNDPHGRRFHHLTSEEAQMAAAAIVLLSPSIPLIFMGEEWAAAEPFHFFTDFTDDHLREAVVRGRAAEYPAIAGAESISPVSEHAFHQSRLEHRSNRMRNWYKRLIEIRRSLRTSHEGSRQMCDIQFDRATSTFALSFKAADNKEPFFIVANLAEPSNSDRPSRVKLSIEGSVIVDSLSPHPEFASQEPIGEIRRFQAVVGIGKVRLA